MLQRFSGLKRLIGNPSRNYPLVAFGAEGDRKLVFKKNSCGFHTEPVNFAAFSLKIKTLYDPYATLKDSVPYMGSLIQLPSKSVLLRTDIENKSATLDQQLYYEFKSEDILKIEALPFRVSISGEGAVPMYKVWVRKGSIGKKWSSFVVE